MFLRGQMNITVSYQLFGFFFCPPVARQLSRIIHRDFFCRRFYLKEVKVILCFDSRTDDLNEQSKSKNRNEIRKKKKKQKLGKQFYNYCLKRRFILRKKKIYQMSIIKLY